MESSIPCVDIFICTYNRAEYLRKSIESVLHQTYKNFNLIILDNCSSDYTESVVKGFQDKRIKYVRHERNIGGLKNIKLAFEKAQSPFFVVFHDDDVMLPNLIEDELAVLQKNNKIMVCSCKANVINENDEIIKNNMENDGNVVYYKNDEYFSSYFNNCNFIMFPSAMYRLDFIRRNNITICQEAGPSADVLVFFEIERFGGVIAVLNKILMNYRHHINQDTNRSRTEMITKLLNYLKGNRFYSSRLILNLRGQDQFYKQMLKKNIYALLNNNISIDTLGHIKKSYDTSIWRTNSSYYIFSVIIFLLSLSPSFASKLFRITKVIKKFLVV